MSSTSVSTLDIRLIDDVSPGAKAMADALERAGERASQFEKSAARALSSGVSEKLLAKLKGMGAGAEHVTGITKAFGELAKAQNVTLGAGTKLTLEQVQAWKNLENITLSTTRAQLSAERAVADAQTRNHSRRLSEMASERQHFRAHLRNMVQEASAATGIMGGVFGAVKIGEHAFKSGAEYNTEIQNLKDAGGRVTPYIPAAVAEANRVAKEVPGTTAAENLRVINETRMAFGGIEESIKNLKLLQEASQAVKIASEGKQQPSAEEMGQAFAKVFEMRGVAMNEPEFKKQSDAAVQAMVATRGRFTPDKMLDFAQGAGRGTISNMSTRYLTQVVPTLVGDSSSPSMVGNQQKAFRQIIMGHLSSKMQVEAWEKAGLIADPSKVHKKGMTPGWDAGAVVDWQMALSDPDKWVEKHLLPGLKGQGVNVMDPLKLSGALGGLAPKGRANDYLESVSQFTSRKQLDADAVQYTDAHSAAQVVADHARLDPSQGVQNVNSSITSLFSTLTSPMMPAIGTGIDFLRDKINQLNEAAQKSPAVQTATVAAAAVAIPTATYFATKTAANMARSWWNGGSSGHRGPTGPQPVEAPVQTPAEGSLSKVLEVPKVAGFGAAAADLGTIGLLAWWASISDKGMGTKRFSPEAYKANPLGIHLPGEMAPTAPLRPADADDRMKARQDSIEKSATDMLWQFGKIDSSADRLTATLASLETSASGAAQALATMGSGSGGNGAGGGGIINAAYTSDDAPTANHVAQAVAGHRRVMAALGVGGSGGAAYAPTGGGSFVPPAGYPLTAGMRNNNLGNIGFFGQHEAGLIGPSNARDVDHSIARYATQDDGIRAAARLALRKYQAGMVNTASLIAGKHGWTPGALGPGASVNVARSMGLSNRDDLHLDDPAHMAQFLHGLAVQEHGKAGGWYSDGKIKGALGLRPDTSPRRPRITPTSHDTMASLTPAVDLQHLHHAAQLTREIKGNLADISTMSAPHARGVKPGAVRTAMNRQFAGHAGRMG